MEAAKPESDVTNIKPIKEEGSLNTPQTEAQDTAGQRRATGKSPTEDERITATIFDRR